MYLFEAHIKTNNGPETCMIFGEDQRDAVESAMQAIREEFGESASVLRVEAITRSSGMISRGELWRLLNKETGVMDGLRQAAIAHSAILASIDELRSNLLAYKEAFLMVESETNAPISERSDTASDSQSSEVAESPTENLD